MRSSSIGVGRIGLSDMIIDVEQGDAATRQWLDDLEHKVSAKIAASHLQGA